MSTFTLTVILHTCNDTLHPFQIATSYWEVLDIIEVGYSIIMHIKVVHCCKMSAVAKEL